MKIEILDSNNNMPKEPRFTTKINVLDKGYAELIDVMGTDNSIAEDARVSTQSENKTPDGLIRRLIRDRHTSPIEFPVIKVELKAPLFVAMHILRHRTAKQMNINMQSLRYTESDCEFYLPSIERMQEQNKDNRQGSGEMLSRNSAEIARIIISGSQRDSEKRYKELLDLGLTRELARIVLDPAVYVKWRFQLDLHNLFHFLKLRTDPHAQWETQQYAIAIESIVKEKFPIAYNAWVDYVKEAVTFSRIEMQILKDYKFRYVDIEHDARINRSDYNITKSEYINLLEKLK